MRQRRVEIPSLAGTQYDGKPASGWTAYTVFKCSDCKRIRQNVDAFTTGYGYPTSKSKRKICFECCGRNERRAMLKTGKATSFQSNGSVFRDTRLMRCGRSLVPLNFFETLADADRHTGGRLERYICQQCEKRNG